MIHRTLGAALIALSAYVATAGAAGGVIPPTGDAQGLALLARVERAYARVPAVVTSARFRGMNARFTLLLDRGVAVGEEFVGATSAGTTILVARDGGPTYAREPGATCWRRFAPTDRQSLEDLGVRFPDGYKTIVGAPTRAGAVWLLPIHTEGRFPGEGGTFVMHIDSKTMLVETETGRVSGQPLANHITELGRAPALPRPQPPC